MGRNKSGTKSGRKARDNAYRDQEKARRRANTVKRRMTEAGITDPVDRGIVLSDKELTERVYRGDDVTAAIELEKTS